MLNVNFLVVLVLLLSPAMVIEALPAEMPRRFCNSTWVSGSGDR